MATSHKGQSKVKVSEIKIHMTVKVTEPRYGDVQVGWDTVMCRWGGIL
jgi:hypothetical protein